jgi:hypothetical protein
MLTGSLASAVHGTPRATQDIDVVIAPDRTSLERLLEQFPEQQYYVSREAALEAYERRELFNVIDVETGWKIDFILRKNRPFSEAEFDRRTLTDALGLQFYVASAEDTLIAKLEWAKMGESERQLRDAAGIMRTQGRDLDLSYVETWVNELELKSQWRAARNLVSQE